ncbi:MAG: OmpH family outer membrane protein [Bacteroidales bacterium]|nr:OmpH family outer membrane protein [Bacteroidales bacterium]
MRYLFTLLALLVMIPMMQAQELKFGHFNSAAFMEQMPEIKQLQADMDKRQSEVETQVANLRELGEKKMQEFQAKQASMTDDEKKAAFTELQELDQRVQSFVSTSQQDLQRQMQERMLPIQQKLLRVVQEVGVENNFLYILESEAGLAVHISDKSVDVTPLIKAKLGM